MSLFGKIKSAVRGNPVTKEFEVGRHVASAGPGLLWKVYNGVKKSTRKEVSLFMFDKKAVEFEKQPKRQREATLEMLRKGPTHLVRLRHPRLLTIEHPIEESNDLLAFATEPVFASLANLLGHYDNMPSPLPLVIKEFELYPVELQYGLLQVAEALHFLHKEARLLHGNLTPQSVAVTREGGWKLMGFNFSCFSQYQSDAQTSFAFREWDSRQPLHTNPSLDFLAPEYVLSRSCSEQSDVFSYAMLCYAVYNQGKPLFLNHNNTLSFKQNAEQVSRITEAALGAVPAEFKPLVRSGLAIEPSVRPDALQVTKHPFFEEIAVATLTYLDMLYERGDMEKSQFFKKNLARVITKLPKRVVHQRVLPALSAEFRNPLMVPFILPLVLLVAEDCSIQEYTSLILPILIPALRIQEPIQVPLILLQKMELLLKKTPQEDIKRHILPMIIRSLETEHGQLQELCVSIIPSFADVLDYSSMKHSIVPRITALCISTNSLSLRVKCLVCVGQMLEVLDRHIVLDHVLPVLQQVPSREPGVLMAILGIFHQVLLNKKLGLDKTLLATRVLPFLLPLSIEPGLNVQQFTQFLRVIREMLQKVEGEHEAYLQQLSTMEEQTKSTVQFAKEVSETKAMDDALNRLEDMFSGSTTESRDHTPMPRRGTSTLTSGTTPPQKEPPANTEGPDLLAGLSLTATPSPAAAAHPQSSLKQLSFASASPNPPNPPPPSSSSQPSRDSSLLSTQSADVLHPTSAQAKPSLSSLAAAQKTGSSGYTPPQMRQKTGQTGNENWASSSGDLDILSGTGSMHSANGVQQTSRAESSAMFSGMHVNSVQPSAGLYSGMQVNQPGATLQPMSAPSNHHQRQPQSHMTGLTNQSAQSGMAAPLVPTQTATGWSSEMNTTQGSNNTHNNPAAVNLNSGQAGFNSGQAGFMGNPSGGSSSGGWSQNIAGSGSMHSGTQYGMGAGPPQGGMGINPLQQQQQYGMGAGHPQGGMGMNQQQQQQYGMGPGPPQGGAGVNPQQQQQYGMGTGSNAGMGIGNQQQGMGYGQNSGWNQTNQMQPSSHMMGGGQPLLPTNVSSPRQPSQQQQQQQPMAQTPGANPFADLSFLS